MTIRREHATQAEVIEALEAEIERCGSVKLFCAAHNLTYPNSYIYDMLNGKLQVNRKLLSYLGFGKRRVIEYYRIVDTNKDGA